LNDHWGRKAGGNSRNDCDELGHSRLPLVDVFHLFTDTTNGAGDFGHCWTFSCAQPMADFKSVAARVFKKDRIVTGFIIHRAFDIARANARHDLRDSIHVRRTFGPERDAVSLGR
jgi:hypothetical protein